MAGNRMGFQRRMPGAWTQLMVQSPNSFGTAQVFDFTNASPINTDLARVGRKGYVACIAVRVRYRVTVPVGGGTTLYNTKRQRGCTTFVKVDQPAMEYAMFEGVRPISEVWFASQIANLPATRLVDFMPSKRPEVSPDIIDPATRGVLNISGQDDARAGNSWQDFEELAVCLNDTGAPVVQEIDDIFPIAFTRASRNERDDLLPLHYFTSEGPRTPVKLTITVRPTGLGVAGYPAGTTFTGPGGVDLVPVVELWAYVVPMRADRDDLPLGMPYAYRVVGRNGPTIVMDPLRSYRAVGIAPDFESTTTDTGLRVFYEPRNWPTYLTGDVRWQDKMGGASWVDVFPLYMSAAEGPIRRDVLDGWNTTSAKDWAAGMNRDAVSPIILPLDPSRGASRLNDRGVANCVTWASVGLTGTGLSQILGPQSFSPLFPLAWTSYISESFPGFGDPKADCAPQLYLQPDDRPTVECFEVWDNPQGMATVAKKDTGTANCGCEGGVEKPIYTAALDNKNSPTAAFAVPMVPMVAKRTIGQAIQGAMNMAEIPPGTLAKINGQSLTQK
jgi:hypothetical protein